MKEHILGNNFAVGRLIINKERGMNFLSKVSLLLSVFVFSATGAQASHYLKAQDQIKRLFESVDNVVLAQRHVDRGEFDQARTRLRVADYRVRLVLSEVRYEYGLEKATEALGIIHDKLSDTGLGIQEKIDLTFDCLGAAIPDLVKEIGTSPRERLRATRQLFKLAKVLGKHQFFGRITEFLEQAKGFLYGTCPYSNSVLQKAINAIEIAIEKASDSYLLDDEKEYFLFDCLRVAEEHITEIEYFYGIR